MILNWIYFFVLGVCAYIGISYFAQLTGGGSTTALQAAIASLKPIPILILIVANVFFALAIFFGFKNTKLAIPAVLAIGVITSSVYSVVILGASFSFMELVGVALILVGIFFLAD